MKIIHFADLHIGVENYGTLNPETGLNTRLEDFLKALDTLIDTAIKDAVDLVIFAGDAFKVNEPTNTHQRVFAERIQRLSQAQVPTLLLIGNHDQTNKYGESHAMDIYNTLSIPHVTVSSRPEFHVLETPAGLVQVATLPHVSKSALLTLDDFASQTFAEADRSVIDQVDAILDHFEQRIDPSIPAILVAHVGIEQAKMGSEHSMSIGYGFTIPLSLVTRDCFDYVALGHVHKHQVLCEDPPVIYPGSLERVDFGEEKEDKGYMALEWDGSRFEHRFVCVPGRPFVTLKKDLKNCDDPMNELLQLIEKKDTQHAIVRVLYTIQTQRMDEVDHKVLKDLLQDSFHTSIRPTFDDEDERIRMPELESEEALNPMETFAKYLDKRPDLAPHASALEEKAQALWERLHALS